jgi:hypothetical protein
MVAIFCTAENSLPRFNYRIEFDLPWEQDAICKTLTQSNGGILLLI